MPLGIRMSRFSATCFFDTPASPPVRTGRSSACNARRDGSRRRRHYLRPARRRPICNSTGRSRASRSFSLSGVRRLREGFKNQPTRCPGRVMRAAQRRIPNCENRSGNNLLVLASGNTQGESRTIPVPARITFLPSQEHAPAGTFLQACGDVSRLSLVTRTIMHLATLLTRGCFNASTRN